MVTRNAAGEVAAPSTVPAKPHFYQCLDVIVWANLQVATDQHPVFILEDSDA